MDTQQYSKQELDKPSGQAIRPSSPPLTEDGVLVLYKPSGISSAACVNKVKRLLKAQKAGHAGTLDPMANGVLLVLLGQATKISSPLMLEGKKIYSGSIRLGVATDTWDMDGAILEEHDCSTVSELEINAAMQALLGRYQQEVPAYAAAKHEGRPLYALARKGLPVPKKEKTITVFSGEIESVDLPLVRFRVACSSGTYIRSLAHSLGMRLGCKAALASLTREYSHPFGLDQAVHLEDLQQNPDLARQKLFGFPAALPDWIQIEVPNSQLPRLQNGHPLPQAALTEQLFFEQGRRALLKDSTGRAVALAQATLQNGEPVWTLIRGLWTHSS